jgi:hypothetical protein
MYIPLVWRGTPRIQNQLEFAWDKNTFSSQILFIVILESTLGQVRTCELGAKTLHFISFHPSFFPTLIQLQRISSVR